MGVVLKGIIQSGMIQAVLDNGVDYDVAYGSSAGSLNGLMLHQGDVDALKSLWMSITNDDVYKWSVIDAINPFNKKASLYDSSPLLKTIRKYLDVQKLQANPRDFVISATDYSTWAPFYAEVKTLDPEDLALALYASASPPIYFPFVEFNGQLLADAGVLTNFNIAKAVEDGMDTVIVLGFAHADPKVPENVKDNMSETLSIAMYGYFQKELKFIDTINKMIAGLPPNVTPFKPIKVVVITPPGDTGLALLDFNYTEDRELLWKWGYDMAKDVLDKELPKCAPTS